MLRRISQHYFIVYCSLVAFLIATTLLWNRSCSETTFVERTLLQTQRRSTSKPLAGSQVRSQRHLAQSKRSLWQGNCTVHLYGRNRTQLWESRAKQDAARKKHNAREDSMLQTYLLAEMENIKTKGVITILANLPRHDKLRMSLELLYKNFNHHFAYPVVIFHEADFLPKIQDLQQLGFNKQRKMSSVFFQQIDMSVPQWFIKKFGQPPKDVCGPAKHIGYRSMCRFQAKLIYEQPIMRHFDYHWRLDDDSLITAKISFDVFAVLKNGGFSYGYYETNIDMCTGNTYSVTADYIRSKKIVPTFFNWLKKNEIFFNNFEISSMKVWRSKQFRDYIDYMDSLGGFYTHRWGDAPVKTLFLSMFVPVREIYQFSNVSYSHHTLRSRISTKFLN